MKKYNKLIMASIAMYVLLAVFSGAMILQLKQERNNFHRVEANRVLAEIKRNDTFMVPDLSAYQTIKNVAYLDAKEENERAIQLFYSEQNENYSMILPWMQGQTLKGYLKFEYLPSDHTTMKLLVLLEGFLLWMEIFILVILLYLRKKILKPFVQLKEAPHQLANGHYKGEIYTEKSKYFHHYLQGMSRLKDELDVSLKRQMELSKDKKQMLLSLSHDIKTPLNMIKLYGKALEEDIYEDEESRRKALQQIDVKCEEIEMYINTIMKSSREDILEFVVEQGEFYLADLMERVLEVYLPQCAQRSIDCKVDAYQNRLLKGDIHRAQEVMENLFENAIKYGDGKAIHITFKEEDYCQLICIYNTGVSVSDQDINHLFDSFYRGTNAKGKQGSGLGLYICKSLMHKMDGAIYAEKADDGMTFVLIFR